MTVSAGDIEKLHRAINRYNDMAKWVRGMRANHHVGIAVSIGSSTSPSATPVIEHIEKMLKDDLDYYLDAALAEQFNNVCIEAENCEIPVDNIELEPNDNS